MPSTDHSSRTSYQFPIVGIGASAGGLRAIQELLEHLPNDTGMSFVIVQHLSRNFKSLMQEILAKGTTLPVHMAEDKLQLQPDNIYLIPAGHNLTILNHHFVVKEQGEDRHNHFVIDLFLHSLGVEVKENAFAVILSGTGTDGSRGIRTVKEEGGIVLVQEPRSGDFDGMPQSAIDTHIVDFVLTPKEIGQKLQELILLRRDAKRSAKGAEAGNIEGEVISTADQQITDILSTLYRTTHVDFSLYKSSTIQRRIEKHMSLHTIQSYKVYHEFLKADPERVDELYEEILIGVTEFFRDEAAYEALRKIVLPSMVEKMTRKEMIRIWVCGCATGEEVYSIAILLLEYARIHNHSPRFTILATDISRMSLATASQGRYTERQLNRLEQEVKDRYFSFDGEKYQVQSIVRDNVIFARNDATSDPPFVNLDLVTCRNLLIYLQPRIQRRLLLNFHFGLNHEGHLFLGPSENILEFKPNFKVLNERWKLFQTQGPTPNLRRFFRFTDVSQLPRQKAKEVPVPRGYTSTVKGQPRVGYAQLMLNRYPHPFVLFDANAQLLFSGAGANEFLSVPPLNPNSNLLNMVSKATITVIRDGLKRIQQENTPFHYPSIPVKEGDRTVVRDLYLEKIKAREDEFLYLMEWREPEETETQEETQTVKIDVEHADLLAVVKELQDNLVAAEDEIQSTLEQLETSNEELQAANEELIAANEELQSTNEELQSVNEELHTVNTELQTRNHELTQANLTIDNLLSAIDIGTLHIDASLNIRFYTPAFTRIADLKTSDIGASLRKFHLNWEYPQFVNDVYDVLHKGSKIEREVPGKKPGETFLVRLFPLSTERSVDEVVVAVIDISEMKNVARALKATEQNQRRILDALPLIVSIVSPDGIIRYINRTERGFSRQEAIGTSVYDYLTPTAAQEFQRAVKEAAQTRHNRTYHSTSYSADGDILNLQNILVPILTPMGAIEDLLQVSIPLDEQRLISETEFRQMKNYGSLMSNQSLLMTIKEQDYTYNYVSPSFARLLKKPVNAILGQNDYSLFPESIAMLLRDADERALTYERQVFNIDKYEVGGLLVRTISLRFPMHMEAGRNQIGQISLLVSENFFLENDASIEAQRKLEKVVDERTQALVQANQELRTITRSMAHDLRTPLRAIQSFGEMLMDSTDMKLSPQERDFLVKIRKQSNKMAQIISGLISYVKLGSIAMHMEWLDPKAIAIEAWDDLKHLLDGEEGKLSLHTCPPLWADLFMVKQVITNLFSNSIKYRSSDRVLSVEFGSYSDDEGSRWVYYVKDNGVGFDPKYAEKVFQVFERLHSGQKVEGYGVGLSIVKKSIELMGGKVWVTASIGQGATFYFSLPKEGGKAVENGQASEGVVVE